MSRNPYTGLPRDRFWVSGVAAAKTSAPPGLYKPKWKISPSDRIATAGSCFAQHVGRHLRLNRFNVLDLEPPPQGLPFSKHHTFGYSLYSARYGNIYTTRQLLQLAKEAFGEFAPADAVWRKGSLFIDALRPSVEPEGMHNEDEVRVHREYHLNRVREMLLEMDVFVFTLGLTECWVHTASGTAYPTVPGSVAGAFDESLHGFRNLRFNEVCDDFLEFRQLVSRFRNNKACRFLLTVSPVPLAATASGQHVLAATIHSKSTLRAAAGELSDSLPDVDYFPSFEIITNPWSPDDFYEKNRRDVSQAGVALAMRTFLSMHLAISEPDPAPVVATDERVDQQPQADDDTDVVCEEMLLQKFGPAI